MLYLHPSFRPTPLRLVYRLLPTTPRVLSFRQRPAADCSRVLCLFVMLFLGSACQGNSPSGALAITTITIGTTDTTPTAPTTPITPFATTPVATVAMKGGPAGDKTYIDPKVGYTVSYPANWYPSGITYANAFEIRNYPPKDAGAVPERNRASLVIVNTLTDNAQVAERSLDSQVSPDSTPLTIDGYRAIRVQRELLAQPLAPGTTGTLEGTPTTASPRSYRYISTYIAAGRYVVAMEASAPSLAAPSVIADILQIENSIQFN